jgi:hypothetical protein
MHTKYGATVWLIPDGYYPEHSSGEFPSHEAICVLNSSPTDAEIEVTLYFEDRPKQGGFRATCPAERTKHIRMDRLQDGQGNGVPAGVAYAMLVQSNTEIVVQYSRMDTTQAAMALMTTIAYQG